MIDAGPGLLAARTGDVVRHVRSGVVMGVSHRRGRYVINCMWPGLYDAWVCQDFDIGELALVKPSVRDPNRYLDCHGVPDLDAWYRMVEALEART